MKKLLALIAFSVLLLVPVGAQKVFAGVVASATIGDFVWEDRNANGLQDAFEPGIPGVKVTLTGGGPDGIIGSGGDDTTAMDFTDANGFYQFNDLNPGEEYKVTFTDPDPVGPDAYMFSPRQVGGDSAVDSDGPISDIVVLASDEVNDTIDSGLFRKGSIHIFGYLDNDGDGNFDPEDGAFPDVPGKAFELLVESGNVIATTTSFDGMVWFEDLVPGTYTARENPIPEGFLLTTLPNERTFTIESGQELVYEDGAAMLDPGDTRFETNLGDDLRWGNADSPPPTVVGGEIIPIDTTMVLVAGTQSVAAWMIPVLVSAIGIAIVIARKF